MATNIYTEQHSLNMLGKTSLKKHFH